MGFRLGVVTRLDVGGEVGVGEGVCDADGAVLVGAAWLGGTAVVGGEADRSEISQATGGTSAKAEPTAITTVQSSRPMATSRPRDAGRDGGPPAPLRRAGRSSSVRRGGTGSVRRGGKGSVRRGGKGSVRRGGTGSSPGRLSVTRSHPRSAARPDRSDTASFPVTGHTCARMARATRHRAAIRKSIDITASTSQAVRT